MAPFDWEQFKRDIAHLNEPRTKEDRASIINKEAKSSWRVASNQMTSIFRYSTHPETKLKTPSPLAVLAAIAIKKQMFIKQYTDLIENITQGNENIYPEQWNWESVCIRDKIVQIQTYTLEKINQITRIFVTEELRKEDFVSDPQSLSDLVFVNS